jgi:hypothetical protein
VLLGIAERGALLDAVPPLGHAAALAEAAGWLATRDPSELATRDPIGELTFSSG